MFHPRQAFHRVGPGVITGASDDDPSGIAVYAQTGAQFGYSMLWLALITTPLMMAVQEMSARVGMASGRGLAASLRRTTSRRFVLWLCAALFLVNTVNIGADLGAMAEATRLLVAWPTWLILIVFAAGIVLLEIVVRYRRYVTILRWLTAALLAYVVAAFTVTLDWGAVFHGTFVPILEFGRPETWAVVVAVLGTTISPYLFFWQASEEVEEEVSRGRRTVRARRGVTKFELRRMRGDVRTGMIFSNVIMFFIIVTAAATLHPAGVTNIETAAQAAEALRPLAAGATFWLFALGIIGTGLLAIPILAGSASYAVAEVFGWREGLDRGFRQAHAFYLSIAAAVVLGVLMNALGIPPMRSLLFAAVLNGLLAPVVLWHLIRAADDRRVVGRQRSSPAVRLAGRVTFGVMAAAGLVLLVTLAQ